MIEFRNVAQEKSELLSTAAFSDGILEWEEARSIDSVAVFYRGEGEQLKISFDLIRNVVQCANIVNGYPRVLFRKRLKSAIKGSAKIIFNQYSIEVRLDGSYIGSSYIDRMSGYVRIHGARPYDESTVIPKFSAAKAEYKALFIGDGFTGGNWPHVNYWMWPDLISKGSYPILNAGESAANTRRALEVVERLSSDDVIHFEEVYIMIGVDDVIDGVPIDETLSNFEEILNALEKLGDRVYLCTLTPRKDRLQNLIENLNEHILGFQSREGVFEIINVAKSFENESLEEVLFAVDFPNKLGQELIASAVMLVNGDVTVPDCKSKIVLERNFLSKLFHTMGNKFYGLASRVE
ncbi:MAG: hypothetical protein ABGY95_12235 [Rubritalea sp.]|uniref:SGNH/GDSL hydrolase family protein n=1 Tax=Rubritalea sp. TaxID=2109375 RepID=UPI0032421FA3